MPISIRSSGTGTDTTQQTPKIFLRHAGASDTGDLPLPGVGPARCDSIAVRGTSGCAFSDVAAAYVLQLHGHGVNAVAAHIQTAQRNKPRHFGWFNHGSPLTRATSSAVARRNRRAACAGKHFAPPAGLCAGRGSPWQLPGQYASGMPLRPSTSWWRDLTRRSTGKVAAEYLGRTFALVGLLVHASWRLQGITAALHDLILAGRPEERATL